MKAIAKPGRVPRDMVSARIDPAVLEVVERVAEAERRPVSSVIRNIVSDWVAARQAGERVSA